MAGTTTEQGQQIHFGDRLDDATLELLADFICGDNSERYPVYRSSSYLTRFFQSIGINATHDGSTRKWWVLSVLQQLPPGDLEKVVLRLVNLKEYKGDKTQLALAARSMNDALAIDGFGVSFQGTAPILVRAEPLTITADDLKRPPAAETAHDFLASQFSDDLRVDVLNLDAVLTPILQSRIDEVQACPRDKVHLGTIFLLGSTLEGILIGVATKAPQRFITADCAPKDKNGTVRKIYDWKLAELIDVTHEIGVLNLDVKKFSHVLRDFRNYVHPYHQMSHGFAPDQDTVDICWQVFKAAFAQLRAAKI